MLFHWHTDMVGNARCRTRRFRWDIQRQRESEGNTKQEAVVPKGLRSITKPTAKLNWGRGFCYLRFFVARDARRFVRIVHIHSFGAMRSEMQWGCVPCSGCPTSPLGGRLQGWGQAEVSSTKKALRRQEINMACMKLLDSDCTFSHFACLDLQVEGSRLWRKLQARSWTLLSCRR